MSEAKEFTGKSLDAAIAEACSYYNVPREKLEIEIIEDAKTGIFGIVGARKAKIMARIASLPEFMQSAAQGKAERRRKGERRKDKADFAELKAEPKKEEDRQEPPCQEAEEGAAAKKPMESPAKNAAAAPQSAANQEPAPKSAANQEPAPQSSAAAVEPSSPQDGVKSSEASADTEDEPHSRISQPYSKEFPRQESVKSEEADSQETYLPRLPISELNPEKLTAAAKDIIGKLVAPILDIEPEEVDLFVEIAEDRLQVSIKSAYMGLLIGRDGQNISAVQYLASRMIARAVGSQIRLQVDAGDYHVRQDSRLQELALSLAEKVRATGKAQTTRPLSPYQRRVIHLALQDEPDVQTRSSGEGALKHVVILPRKD